MAFTEHLYRSVAKASHSSPEATAASFEEFAKATGEDISDIDAHEVFQMIRDDAYQVEVPRSYIIDLMMDGALHLAEVLMALSWTFVRAPNDIHFITSDAPFIIAPPAGEQDWRAYGVLTPGAITTIPLSPSVCVVVDGEGRKDRYGHMRKDAVRRVNANVAQNSDRFIVARDQPYLERLVKRTRVDNYRWTSRFDLQDVEIDGESFFHAKRNRPPG